MRCTTRMVTFAHPFTLAGVDGIQPAGTYTVEIDEEEIAGLSYSAFRRVDTRIVLPLSGIGMIGNQTVPIGLADVEAALAADAAR